MLARILADVVVVAHLAFVLFVVLGGFLVVRRPRVAWVHLPCAAWGAAIEIAGAVCPLTPLENALRRAGGEAGYGGGFVEHYVLPVLYPGEMTLAVRVGLAGIVVAANAVAYTAAWRRGRMRAGSGEDGRRTP